ncbi:MAG: F0F1 ATP synthase subunit B [Gemmatimonadetes bacterium]|nr:F0F1 ATP synthase subunit B [Gemmatimonadota bacterium]
MNVLRVIQEHAAQAAEPNVFNLTTGVSFWTLVIFLGLLFVLSRWAFPPILGYAAAREKRIQNQLDEAKRTRDEAAALLASQRADLAQARAQAQEIIAEGRQAAEKVRADLLERTKADQEAAVLRAKHEIEQESQRALEQVRREAVELAIAAAARLLEARLGTEQDRRLVTEYLSRAAPASRAGTA